MSPTLSCLSPSSARRGSALVISSITVIVIAGMALALTDLTIGRFGEQRYRQTQVDLLAATESAANETINWLNDNTSVKDALKNLTVTTKPAFPEDKESTSAVLVSGALPSGLPEVFPALGKGYTTSGGTTTAVSSGANTANLRNTCTVQTKVIKVAGAAPSAWDGTEYFIVYTTATAGDPARPDTIRRQRVETVIHATSITTPITTTTTTNVPTPAYPFTRGMFALNGYDFKGTADTDSWISDTDKDGVADTPYKAPVTYGAPGTDNSNGDVGSNGVLGSGAYDTKQIHGEATPNAEATLPNVTYDPPSTGYTALKAITNNATITGTSTDATIYRVPSINQKNGNALTIGGSGTVVLYVDGAFNVGDVNFVTGSTAKLIIYQNDVAGSKGCSFNAQNNVGDPGDPSRFLFVTAFSGTGSNEMKLNGGASFSGVVLAPNAGIKFTGGSDFYGSFVGQDFSGAVNGNFSFHYDESLAGKSWGEIMTPITTSGTVNVQELDKLNPINWNVHTVGYIAP